MQVGSDSLDGSDLFFGIGGVLDLSQQLEIRMILQQYSVGSEQIDVISA